MEVKREYDEKHDYKNVKRPVSTAFWTLYCTLFNRITRDIQSDVIQRRQWISRK